MKHTNGRVMVSLIVALALAVAVTVAGVVALASVGQYVGGRVAAAGPEAAVPAALADDSDPLSATILIRKGGLNSGYGTPAVTISHGGQLSVLNLDTYTHTVTSVATDAGGAPLFDVTIPPGATRLVSAATALAAGSYEFYCRFHPNMRGTLTVVGQEGSGGTQAAVPHFTLPLRLPRTLRSSHIRMVMRRTKERMLPTGPLTATWTYGGSWPGPTIRRPAGRRTLVTVANELPAKAGAVTMHLHGDHHASRDDGQPTDFLVHRGQSRTYRYDLTDAGRPEPSSFFWYHDHRMDRTSRNNWMGLQGMFIVGDAHGATFGLPHGRRDVPLMISDRSFTSRNQLTSLHEPTMTMGHGMRFMGPSAPPNDANVGTRMLVDGRYAPHLRTAAVHYRLRLLNSSSSSSYNLALSDGRPFVQVGTGDGLLPHPVVRQTILLGPAQRADVVVDFHGETGQNVVLQTVARTDTDVGTGSRIGPLMQFRVGATARDRTHIPAALPTPARIRIPRSVAKTWTFSLAGNKRNGTFWAINNKAFDPARVDHRVRLGTTEKWVLRNTSDVTHYVHIHEEQWHTVSRDGSRPPPWERGLEDTWRLDPGEVVVVAARFTDYTGKFMIHCHMLDHEDHGMMAYYQVVR